MNYDQVTVEDSLGQQFPLHKCTLLCAKYGSLDYGDPIALIFPDGETIVSIYEPTMLNDLGSIIGVDEINWDPEENENG